MENQFISSLEQKEKLELLHKTLQESYQLKLEGLDKSDGSTNTWPGNIRSISEEKNIELDTNDAWQNAYNKKLETGDIQNASYLVELVEKHNLQLNLTPNASSLQACYEKLFPYVEEVKLLAEQNNIILEGKEELAQKAYDDCFGIKGSMGRLEYLEEFADSNGLKLEVKEQLLQKAYNYKLVPMSDSDREMMEKIKQFANEKNITLEIQQEALQEKYDFLVEDFNSHYINLIEELAKEKGVTFEVKQTLLQKAFNTKSFPNKQDIIIEFAKSKNITLDLSKKIEDSPDTSEDDILNGDSLERHMDRLERIDQENLQKYEELYIKVIHSFESGHIDFVREKLLRMLQEAGSDMSYENVVSADYLDYLQVPEENRMRIEKKFTIENAPVKAKFYGKKEDVMRGKFILGVNVDNTLELIFDSTFGEHRDIGIRNNVSILGGGWLEIDEENKKVILYGKSKDFGREPRSISCKVVEESFEGYEVEERE